MPSVEATAKPLTAPFLARMGYMVWWVLLLLSVVFYKERAFFLDAGFQLFNLINEEAIQVYHYRFVTVLPQVFPFLLMKAGAPLWVLAVAYSASYILFFLFVYHFLVRWLGNVKLGLALVCLFTLTSLDTFYHIQSEFYLGMALLLLAFGVVVRRPSLQEAWQWAWLFLLLPTVAFSHKLSGALFVFLWVFFWLGNQELRHRRYIVFLAVFLLATAVKSIFFTNWYEAAKQAEFKANLDHYFPYLHELPSNLVLLERCLHHYYMLPILLGGVTVFYFSKKQWVKMCLMWAFVLGFALLYNIADPQAQYRFYSEVSYLPLMLFVAVPLVVDVFPALEKRAAALGFVCGAVLAVRLFVIAANHDVFENNHDWVVSQFEKSDPPGAVRLLMRSENVPADTVIMEWGVPFTAMHLTALDDPAEAKTLLVMPDFDWYKDKMNEADVFFSPFHKVLKKEDLNLRYFDPKDGTYIFKEN